MNRGKALLKIGNLRFLRGFSRRRLQRFAEGIPPPLPAPQHLQQQLFFASIEYRPCGERPLPDRLTT
jgi:hypothetical protein